MNHKSNLDAAQSMQSAICIDDLPEDVLIEILLHLNFKDLVYSARHVCTRWKEASENILIWKNLTYCAELGLTDNKISDDLKQAPKLRSIILKYRSVGMPVLKTVTDNCPELRKLEFSICQSLSYTFMKNLVVKCPNIELLSISSVMPDGPCEVNAIGQLRYLKEITLGWPDKGILKSIADGCPCLQRINLLDKGIIYDDFAYFIAKKQNQLQHLEISCMSIDKKCLVSLLRDCKKLKKLIVSDCLRDIGACFHSLAGLKSLTSLTLEYFMGADVEYLINVFDKHNLMNLEELCIDRCQSYDDRLANVIVKNCPKLKVLFLRNMYLLSDESVVNFYLLADLENVDLQYTDVSDASVMSLTRCSKLKYLNLSGCWKISETGMMLMAEFCNLHVLQLADMNIKGLPFSYFSSYLPHLKYLDVALSFGADHNALSWLKFQKPELKVEDPYSHVGIGEEDQEEDEEV